MKVNLESITISKMSKLIKERVITPVDLYNYVIDRIEHYDDSLNSFINIMGDEALKQARLAQKDIESGKYKGSLHGIPISLKDTIDYAGHPTTNGSKVKPIHIPTSHAAVTQKLVNAGAIIIGKSHLNEYAYRAPHPYYGLVKNPWNTSRIPGGSSSGSAVGVQAGFALGAIGTDTGGSIRMPASLCGLVGLKPTYDLVSRDGITPLAWSLDHVGPITKTCEDAWIMLQAIMDTDYRAEVIRGPQLIKKLDTLNGKKIGIPTKYFFDNVETEVELAVKEAISFMEGKGAEIILIDIPGLDEINTAQQVILKSEAYAYHRNNLENQRNTYGPQVRSILEVGQFFSAETYIQSQRYRTHARNEYEGMFTKIDFLVTPTTPAVATEFEKSENSKLPFYNQFTKFNSLTNFLGFPSLSLPCGFTADGMPIGMQFIGSPYSEKEILDLGHFYESNFPWYKKTPDENEW